MAPATRPRPGGSLVPRLGAKGGDSSMAKKKAAKKKKK
jgi:hypothetical protein